MYRRVGELYDARGDRQKALEYYGKFVELWKNADPELQPAVKEAKGRMARLAREHYVLAEPGLRRPALGDVVIEVLRLAVMSARAYNTYSIRIEGVECRRN